MIPDLENVLCTHKNLILKTNFFTKYYTLKILTLIKKTGNILAKKIIHK